MDSVTAARSLMGLSLAFHISFTAVGIGLPLMLFFAEGLALRTGNELYRKMAATWTRVAAVLFAIGAVSGTVLSFEMGLLWPGLMGRFGDVLGLPFAFEGLSFFVEAIFLGIYLVRLGPHAPAPPFGHADPDGRVRRRRHVLCGVGERVDEPPRRV